jgi:anti-sigma factor RsiW
MDPHQDSALDALVKAKATRYEAPAKLRDRIGAALQRSDTTPAVRQRAMRWPAWPQWLNVGVAFACGVIASVVVIQLSPMPDDQDRLAQEVVSGHVRSLMVAHLADVASTDQHTVKPWFTGKLDFSPPVYDLANDGFPLAGGRLDYIERRPVAALVYRHRQHTINVFVWPSAGDLSRERKPLSRQGFNLAGWKDSGMQFWAVSDVSPEELQTFVQLLRKQIANPPPD